MSVQGYWADLPSRAFDDLPEDMVAVLPLGAIEQHGPHLPVSVDRDLIDAVVSNTLDALEPDQNVLILPTLSVTKSGEHSQFPGTLSLSPETLLAVLRDIAASVARAGILRLVLFNAHGGNTAALDIAAREMRIAHEMIVVTCSWFGFADYEGVIAPEELTHDIHAGRIETSAMLATRPDLVNMELAENFVTEAEIWASEFPDIGLSGQPARPGWIATDLNSKGACGNASKATAEVGEHLLSTAATRFAKFLQSFARFDHRGTGR